MRRFMADLAAWLAIVVDATFVGVLMFFGRVVHPIFYGFAAFLSLASVAGGVWMWLTRDNKDDEDEDDTDDDQGGTTGGGDVTGAPPVGKPARPRRPRSIRHWYRHPDQVKQGVR
jgi:hypothetical protein